MTNHPKSKWVDVSRRLPCPICDHTDWCGITDDGGAVRCMRVQSGHESNGGYIHRVGETLAERVKVERKAVPDYPKMTPDQVAGLLAGWGKSTTDTMRAELALVLGVSLDSLRRLGAVWSGLYQAWAFPMSDPDGVPVGIRLRKMDGSKWSVRGSTEGQFIPAGLSDRSTLYIVEGPTDTAALLTLGLDGMGRPSCCGAVAQTVEYLRIRPRRDVVVIGDKDEAKTRPDGSIWFPGQEGAAKLCDAIQPVTRSLKLMYPLAFKDTRKWVQAGATRAVVECVAKAALYYRKEVADGR